MNTEPPIPRRVLVTGAAGRLGRAAVDDLAAHGIATVAADRAALGAVPADRVVVGDLADRDVASDAVRDVDAVLHFAAIPAPTLGTPHEVFVGNVATTFAVLEAAASAGVRRAVFASSLS